MLLDPLADFLSSESADAVQAKRKDDAIFISQTNVEGEVLCRNHAAFPGIADRRG
jgi:hypothetical protein